MIALAASLCTICGRALEVADNPVAADCGGDCWGCVGQIEADGGWPTSVAAVSEEIAQGWRKAEGTAKRPEELAAEGRMRMPA